MAPVCSACSSSRKALAQLLGIHFKPYFLISDWGISAGHSHADHPSHSPSQPWVFFHLCPRFHTLPWIVQSCPESVHPQGLCLFHAQMSPSFSFLLISGKPPPVCVCMDTDSDLCHSSGTVRQYDDKQICFGQRCVSCS